MVPKNLEALGREVERRAGRTVCDWLPLTADRARVHGRQGQGSG